MSNRISRQAMWMGVARVISQRGTCYRLSVGAIVVENDRDIVGIGYNGAPAGDDHCTGNGCKYFQPTGCQVLHAEANAIRRATYNHYLMLSELFCTHSPCNACVDLILDTPLIRAVYYETEYRDRTSLDRLLRDSTVGLFKVLSSGLIIDQRSGLILDA